MKKYLLISSIIIFLSCIVFSINNGSIFIDGVDKLTANIITIHVEIGLANFFISKYARYIATKNKWYFPYNIWLYWKQFKLAIYGFFYSFLIEEIMYKC